MTLTEHKELVQGTPEWLDARRGIVTASVVGKLIATATPDATLVKCPVCGAEVGGPCLSLAKKATPTPIKTLHDVRCAVAMENLPAAYEVANNDTSRLLTATLVAERITGLTEPTFTNDDMMRGVLHEPIARDRYAEHNKVEVRQIGFQTRDDWGFTIGASPDGLIGTEGGLEVKCPRAKAHIKTIVADEVPAFYIAQVQACLLVSGRSYWDFVSFHAGLPMWTKRVFPDPAWQTAIVDAVVAFEKAAERMTSDYFARAEGLPATERFDMDGVF